MRSLVPRPLALALPLLAAAGLLGGCGTEPRTTSEVRPPSLIQLSASITPDGVTVSPARFGAGPVSLVVANLTDAPQRVTFESAGRDGGFTQQTGPINPRGTSSLSADVPQGTAVVRVEDEDVPGATVRVGPTRASAEDQLLQP